MIRGLLIFVVLVGGAMLAAPFLSEWSPPQQSTETSEPIETKVSDTDLEATLPPVQDPQSLRDVTPQGVTPAPKTDGELTRIYVPPPPKPKLPPPKKRHFQVRVADPVTLQADKTLIRLTGVEPPDRDQKCRPSGDQSVPCYKLAETALKRFIRGRAVTCVYGVREENLIPAKCTVANQDIASWLLQFGWVMPEEGTSDEIKSLVEVAKSNKRGIWSTTN